MKTFKLVNVITGWVIFAISVTVYLLTMEPTVSFWDCGEFISTSSKLEVGHPPGNPVFMLIQNLFSHLAGGDKSRVAFWVNSWSAICSALTTMFLFWSITHLARKIKIKSEEDFTQLNLIAIIGSGIIGALAFAFSDSFWFSAVEGVVWPSSSFVIAVVFWAMLKWENVVHSESIENPYVAARPFRVNAGAVHAYTLTPGGGTKYLADLKAGDEVLLVDYRGKSQLAYLGRNKIEKRPMMLIEAQADEIPISLVMQNAETIRLVNPQGKPISITTLKPGDKVLAHVEMGGRHFGMKVDETLIER